MRERGKIRSLPASPGCLRSQQADLAVAVKPGPHDLPADPDQDRKVQH